MHHERSHEGCICWVQFFMAPDMSYMEVDLDVHCYAYLARKALQAFIPRLGSVVFENAFVVQARRALWISRRDRGGGGLHQACTPQPSTVAVERCPCHTLTLT